MAGPKSPPAENALPIPVSTSTRSSRSSAKSRLKRASSACMRPLMAFRRSGRFKVTTAIPWSRHSIFMVLQLLCRSIGSTGGAFVRSALSEP
jgi:hypothetical protein